MAYTPPASNTVVFNFKNVYVAPGSTTVILDFGASEDPGGGSGEDQLPVARKLLPFFFEEEVWASPVRRIFAPAIGLAGNEALPYKRWMRFDRFDESNDPLPWRNPIRKTPMIAYRGQRRRAAQIIG